MTNRTSPLKRATIFCRDAETSLKLYRDILGFDVIEDKRVSGPAMGKMIGLTDVDMRILHLQSEQAENGLIGLYEVGSDEVAALPAPDKSKIQWGQVAVVMSTNDPNGIAADLEAGGYSFLTPPTKYVKEEDSDYMKAGTYTEMIFFDPDNVLVSVLGFEPK